MKNDLQKANKTIEYLNNQQNIHNKNNNNDIIEQLKKEIKIKDIELNKLKNELENEKNKGNNKFVNFNDIIIIYFTSQDQIINKHAIKCLKTDTFAEIEEKLYQGPILRFKKLYENKIKNGDIIQLIKNE